MEYITIISFDKVEDVPKYAREHSIEKYSIMVIPERGINYPKRFLIVIEESKEEYDFPFIGQYFSTLEETLMVLKTKSKDYKDLQNPYIYWKLINGDYILFSACINYPFNIQKCFK